MSVQTDDAHKELLARLVEIGRSSARITDRYAAHRSPYAAPQAVPEFVPPEPETLYDRHGVLVVRVSDIVVKAHQPDREYGRPFAERIRVANALPRILLSPLGPPQDVNGRTVTVSLYGQPVDPQKELPWEEGGRLLAELHRAPVPADAPPWGRPTRVATQVARLGDGAAEDVVRSAFATLPAWIRGIEPDGVRDGRAECLIHGDWHMGQMVRRATGRWLLIDIEDMGKGDPAWDLARPAALYLSGVLHPDEWTRFLGAYAEAGGPAVPADGDPWPSLDVPARSLAIQIAATCVISARGEDRPLAGPEQAVVDACGRISAAGAGI